MTRRATRVIVGGAVASLALSACTIPVALSETSTTLGASQYLQVHVTLSMKGGGASLAAEEKIVKGLTFDVNEQSLDGRPLAHALNKTNSDLIVWFASRRLATIVDHKSNLYLNVDVAALSHLPGVSIPASDVTAANLVVGNRWFEFPFALVAQYVKKSEHLSITRSTLPATEVKIVDLLVSALAPGATTTAEGVSESGTVASLATSLEAVLPSLTTAITGSTAGTYSVDLSTSGGRVTRLSASETEPAGTTQGTITLNATFAHQGVRVSTPSYPFVITPSFIKKLESTGLGSLGSNGGGLLG